MSSLSTLSSTKSDGSSDALREQIAPLRLNLNCDPCILRSRYKLKALLLGDQQNVRSGEDFVNASNEEKDSKDGKDTINDNNDWFQVQSAMYQAARDMHMAIDVDIIASPKQMAKDIIDASRPGSVYSALIVTLPVNSGTDNTTSSVIYDAVKMAIHVNGMPVFGMGAGYGAAQELGLISFVSQDERLAGRVAAQHFHEHFIKGQNLGNTTQFDAQVDNEEFKMPHIKHAIFIHPKVSDPQNENEDIVDPVTQVRYDAFREALQSPAQLSVLSTATAIVVAKNVSQVVTSQSGFFDVQVDSLFMDAYNKVFDSVTQLSKIFEECSADVVMLGAAGPIVEFAVAARMEHNCTYTQIGVFGDTSAVMEAIIRGDIQFCISSQLYLQSVMPVYLASIFVTTGKALALPLKEKVYLSGPNVITRDSVYTDSLQTCVVDAFPVCPNQLAPSGKISKCPCTDRRKIRIGVSLHGVTTDNFWDPIYVNMQQAADDMGIELDMVRFSPDTHDIINEQMTVRISRLCETGVDGIIVTIPNDAVVPHIQRCRDLGIPVISINSGGDKSVELGLLNHIGMLEYNAGFGGGERLLAAGMKIGFCSTHEPENVAVIERCQGLADAIAAANDPEIRYGGMFVVPRDSAATYAQIAEDFISIDGEWDGVGILCTAAIQVHGWKKLREIHPNMIGGSLDTPPHVLELVERGELLFAINQNPFLQAVIPVYLLTIMAYTEQSLKNYFIETGPQFIDEPSTAAETLCENNLYDVCIETPNEDFNYINDKLVTLGYVLFAILFLLVLSCALFTMKYRTRGVVQVSQPLFGYMMLLGTFVSALSIIFLGVETSHRVLQDQATGLLLGVPNPDITFVDVSCMLVPWFYGLGFAIIFSALFAKINRVRMIYQAGMQMRRQKVMVKDVLPIMGIIIAIEVFLLVLWQCIAPYRWERTVTDDNNGVPLESFGRCLHNGKNYFWLVIIGFHVICLIYALILSYQTRNIVSQFSESSHLFLSVMFMFQVQIMAVPILALVQDNPDAYYFIQAVGIFLQDFTVICLIFGPKVYSIMKGESGIHLGNIATQNVSSRANPRFSTSVYESGSRTFPQSTFTDINKFGSIRVDGNSTSSNNSNHDHVVDNSIHKNDNTTDQPSILMNIRQAVKETRESGDCSSGSEDNDDKSIDNTAVLQTDEQSCGSRSA